VVSIRTSWVESISLIFKGFGALLLEADSLSSHLFFFWIISSAIVFHSLQELHCPYFGILCTAIQKKEVLLWPWLV
jgi:hypothetical protein